MGLRGPSRKPTALVQAEGNRGHCTKERLSANEPIAQPGEPEMPANLSAPAQVIWHSTIPLLLQTPGLLTVLDSFALASYCELRAERDQLLVTIASAQKRAVADWLKTRSDVVNAIRSGEITEDQLEDKQRQAMRITRAEVLDLISTHYSDRRLKYEDHVRKAAREIGLTPSARSSIRIAGGPDGKVKPKVDSVEESFAGRPQLVKLSG